MREMNFVDMKVFEFLTFKIHKKQRDVKFLVKRTNKEMLENGNE